MNSQDFIPLLTYVLLHLNLAYALFHSRTKKAMTLIGLLIAVLLASLFPVFSFIPEVALPLIWYSRAIFGDPGVMLLCLSIWQLWQWLSTWLPKSLQVDPLWSESVWRREVLPLGVSVVALAVVFYPSALGLTWFDLYATGYQPMVLSAFVLFIALGALWTKRYLLSVALAFSLAFWVQGLLDSDNLWDYLMDPLLTLYALIIVGKWTCARLCQSTSHRKA